MEFFLYIYIYKTTWFIQGIVHYCMFSQKNKYNGGTLLLIEFSFFMYNSGLKPSRKCNIWNCNGTSLLAAIFLAGNKSFYHFICQWSVIIDVTMNTAHTHLIIHQLFSARCIYILLKSNKNVFIFSHVFSDSHISSLTLT